MPQSQAYSPKHPGLDMDRQMQLVSLIEFSPQFPPAITLPLMTATHSSELEDSSSQLLILGHLFSVVFDTGLCLANSQTGKDGINGGSIR